MNDLAVRPAFASITPSPDAPAFAEVTQLARWLREGKTTPTRLTEYFLDRVERLGGKFNAVVTVTRSRALAEAERAERELAEGKPRGPLHGIPYGIKDLFATTDSPTSWGAEPFRRQQFDYDATVVKRLADAGAVLVAKLAMVELAGGMGYRQANASFTGPGLSPWNPSAWSGGSSTGPGAAVAAGLVPFAIGTETWGSIVTPAAYCGITGVRPTYGRISRHGAMALSWTMDKIGPMTRTAEDAATVLGTLAGPDPLDPTTLPQPFRGIARKPDRKYRLAVVKGAERRLQKEVAENYRQSIEILARWSEIHEVELPRLPCDAAAGLIISAEMASAFDELIGTDAARTLAAPEDRIGGIANQAILAKDYIHALRLRGRAIGVYAEFLKPFDALVSPTMAAVACPTALRFGEYFRRYSAPGIGGPANLTGIPCVCVPNGFGERGLPTSLQFTGRALSEGMLLRLAHDLQSATEWHTKYPKV